MISPRAFVSMWKKFCSFVFAIPVMMIAVSVRLHFSPQRHKKRVQNRSDGWLLMEGTLRPACIARPQDGLDRRRVFSTATIRY
jgi:hypothetical protein